MVICTTTTLRSATSSNIVAEIFNQVVLPMGGCGLYSDFKFLWMNAKQEDIFIKLKFRYFANINTEAVGLRLALR